MEKTKDNPAAQGDELAQQKAGNFAIDGLAGNINDVDDTPASMEKDTGLKVIVPNFNLEKNKPLREQGNWLIIPPQVTSEMISPNINETEKTVFDTHDKLMSFISAHALNDKDAQLFFNRLKAAANKTRNRAPGQTVSIMLESILHEVNTYNHIQENKSKYVAQAKAKLAAMKKQKSKGKAKRKAQKKARRNKR